MAALVGASKGTVKRLAEGLQRKWAIEVLRPENSSIRQGKAYRVYGTAEVLRRRAEAGYLWSWRNRSAVELVKMTAVDDQPTVASFLSQQRPPANEVASSPPVSTTFARIRMFLDDDAAAKELIVRCREADAQATEEEILYFLKVRVAYLRQRPPVANWREVLLKSVPPYFQRPAGALERYRAENHH
jgi:hypothetical protein